MFSLFSCFFRRSSPPPSESSGLVRGGTEATEAITGAEDSMADTEVSMAAVVGASMAVGEATPAVVVTMAGKQYSTVY